MSVVEIVRIPVAAENFDALVAAIGRAREGYLSAPRCEGFELLGGDGELAAILRWASHDAHEQAGRLPEAGTFLGEVGRLAAGPPSLASFEPVGAVEVRP